MMDVKTLEWAAKKVAKRKFNWKELSYEDQLQLKEWIKDHKPVKNFSAKDVKDAMGKSVEVKGNKMPEGFSDILQLAEEAKKFMEGSETPYISERLRPGYIGKIVESDSGKFVQLERGKPYGTCVAVKSGDQVCIGYSFVNELDVKHEMPIIGLYLAYKRALEGASLNKHGFEGKVDGWRAMDSNTRSQLVHFEKRALSYFHPEVYSHSRGTNSVVYENFDKIRAAQKAILGDKINSPTKAKKAKKAKKASKKA